MVEAPPGRPGRATEDRLGGHIDYAGSQVSTPRSRYAHLPKRPASCVRRTVVVVHERAECAERGGGRRLVPRLSVAKLQGEARRVSP